MILPLLLALGAPDAALVAPEPPPGPESLFKEARALRMTGRCYEAAILYRRLLAEHPKDGRVPETRYWLAATLEQDQRWDEAASAYGDFLRHHPDQRLLGKEARLNRIRCWGIRQGQSPEATPGLVAALEEDAPDVRVAAALQLARTRDGRAEAALQSGLAQPRHSEACRLALESMGLRPQTPAATSARFVVIRIQEHGKKDAVVIRIAAGLARAVASYLSDEHLAQAKVKGVDLAGLVDQIQACPKGSVLFSVEDKESRVTVTVE